MKNTKIDFTRINNDINGNPRYVCHFLNFVNNQDRKEADKQKNVQKTFGTVSILYEIAVKKANTIGGRKFHTKSYGGGIVFQSYNIYDLEKRINKVKNS